MLRWVFILGVYLFCLVSTYTAEQKRMFYILLAQIPLMLALVGLNRLLSGGIIREIAKHLTEEERAESTRLAEAFGARIWSVRGILRRSNNRPHWKVK